MSRFGELLEKLARAEVRYVLVGGGAVLLHGHARVTADLDILVEASEENARRLLAALVTWGEGAGAELTVEELATSQIGALRVLEDHPLDVFTVMLAREAQRQLVYEDVVKDAGSRTLSNGVVVRYASVARLRQMKAGTGRAKDEQDSAILAEIERGMRERQPVDLAGMRGELESGRSEQGEEEWPAST